jgi:hypothetical protein
MRYLTDFVWLLMIGTTLTVFAIYEKVSANGTAVAKSRIKTAILVLCAISLAVAFLSIFAHSKNAVWFSNSIGYAFIKHTIAFWV